MKEQIKIQNGIRETTLSFDDKEKRQAMVYAINNCLNDEINFPTIDYMDSGGLVIFTATYLKNSLIFVPENKSLN